MAVIEVVYETHATSEDNERGIATGWRPGRLSAAGREQARQLGERRRDDGIDAVFHSDLGRAVETAAIAFGGSNLPLNADRRLRECDFGADTGMTVTELRSGRRRHLDEPYPDGESWLDAVARVDGFLDELTTRWGGRRALVIGHTATRWALERRAAGARLTDLLDERFVWRPGWEYRLGE